MPEAFKLFILRKCDIEDHDDVKAAVTSVIKNRCLYNEWLKDSDGVIMRKFSLNYVQPRRQRMASILL